MFKLLQKKEKMAQTLQIEPTLLNMIVKLRSYAISEHRKLINEPAATMTHQDVSNILSTIIFSIDDLIKDSVTFKK